MVHMVVLGSAAGGGFPQWNQNDEAARRARAGEPGVRPRTQASLAVTDDQKRWVLLNASPDLNQQIQARSQLHPPPDAPRRASPISAVVLTGADVDNVTGLLSLRESQPLAVYAHERVSNALRSNPIFGVLNPEFVAWRALECERWVSLADHSGAPLGISIRAFEVPGKVALWREEASEPLFGTASGDTVGLEVKGDGSPSFFYVPGCAAMSRVLAERLRNARLVFFDGTLWRDDELIVQGVGKKTGARMGHMNCQDVIAAFSALSVARKVFIHVNNTNPLLLDDSDERRVAEAAGWEVAFDGMELSL